MLTDLRHALRRLAKRPGFTTAAVATLALGIGATTAMFTVVDSVVVAPLPYDRPNQLVTLDSPVPKLAPDAVWGLSVAGYFYFRHENRTLTDLGAYSTARMNLSGDREARRVAAAAVSRSLFDVLHARPALGRLFTSEEDRPDGPAVVVLGYDFWAREFGSDSGVIGSRVELQSTPREIVGVMAPGIELPDHEVDVWVPLGLDETARAVNSHWVAAIGRLKPGTGVAESQADLRRLTGRLPEMFPQAYYPGFMERYGFTTRVRALHEAVVGDVARVLWILLAAVGLVLLIAAANVANLFAVRVEGRRRELAVRTALGAGRRHLLRQGLAEGLTIALVAGALGVVLAEGGVRLLLAWAPSELPRLAEVDLSTAMAGFAMLLALLLGVLVGLLPLARTRVEAAVLRDALGGSPAKPRQYFVRRALVAAQVGLAVVLLAAAGLMVRSLVRLRGVDSGLDPRNTITFDLNLPYAHYGTYESTLAFYRALVERVEALPGVRVAGAGPVPLRDFGGCALLFVEDQPVVEDERPMCINSQLVAPGYFRALGIPLTGRAPSWQETEAAGAGAVVTATLARRLWPDQDPIGKGIRGNGWDHPFYRVVGVTGELHAEGLDKPPTEAVFYPMVPLPGAPLWSPPRSLTLIVRTDGIGAAALIAPVRRIVSELDGSVPLGSVTAMESVVARSIARRSFAMLLLGIAAGMALILSVVGLYAVVAYVVTQHTKDIGIRMALGAGAGRVAANAVRDALALAAAGCVLGLLGALAATRALRALLYQVSPTDPWTLFGVAVLLLGVAGAAALLPARRAARVDPMEALRNE